MSNIVYESELYHHGIKGQRWGVRRYRDENGELTDLGKRRYANEQARTKKENRLPADPDKWVQEDLQSTKKAVDFAADFSRNLKNPINTKIKRKKINLSDMSDADLQKAINRRQLEQRYTEMFAPEKGKIRRKGKEIVKSTLETAGNVLAVASSALGIAVAIHELKSRNA